ncbi:MAG: extracellular solute-binding protein [Firmicutes bacterium]|nr:extracellular solute-binding protein [Bacillota bacterium]
MKKIISMLLVAVMGVTTLSACGKKEKSGLKVKIAVYDRGAIVASEGSMENNRWTKWIKENSGVDVEFVAFNRNQYKEKLNAMLSSGSAPDVFIEYDSAWMAQLVEQGVIKPVDEMIEKYSKNYKDYLEQNPQLNKYITFGGKSYAFTSQRPETSILNHGAWIRQDWLDKLGLSMPQTDEELLDVLRAFRDRDPNGNGEKDEIPMSLIWTQLIEAMYKSMDQWYLNEKGELEFAQLTDRNMEALRFMKTCYDEGLINKEFATDTQYTLQDQQWANGKTGVYMRQWNPDMCRELITNDPSANPVPLPMVSTKFGKAGYYEEADANLFCMVNANSDADEAIVKFMDWLIDGNWFTLLNGEENVHYTMVDGVPKVIDAEKRNTEVGYAGSYALITDEKTNPEAFILSAADDEISQRLAAMKKDAFEQYLNNNNFERDIPRSPEVSEYAELFGNWSKKRDELRIRVITGGNDATPEWGIEQLRSEWNRLGGEEVNRLVNDWYKANKENF